MLRLGGREFGDHEPVVMAIVGPAGGGWGAAAPERDVLRDVARAVADGAAIVDLDAGDTDFGDVAELVALVGEVRGRHPEVVVAVRTGRHEVADAVCAAGAGLIDDAWGGADPELARVAARHGAGLVCAFTGDPEPDAMAGVLRVTTALAERAVGLGVRPDGILLDPGSALGTATVGRLGELVATGRPVLVSLPEPDFAGAALATGSVAAWLGVRVLRVSAVAQARQALDMVASIAGHRPPAVALRGLG